MKQETREKIAASLRGQKHSSERRARISSGLVGNKNASGHRLSDEAKKTISEKLTGRQLSESHKRAISVATKGKIHSPETRARMGEARLGKSLSQNHPARRKGDQNPGWVGDSIGKSGVHGWLRKVRKHTGRCEYCRRKPGLRTDILDKVYPGTEFANISGEYRRDIDDYAELCRKCHKAFDRGEIDVEDIRRFKLA